MTNPPAYAKHRKNLEWPKCLSDFGELNERQTCFGLNVCRCLNIFRFPKDYTVKIESITFLLSIK